MQAILQGRSASCSRWRPAPARRSWRSRSAGSSGYAAGTATGEHRRPGSCILADRNILVDDPKDKTFAPFGDARWKIENGEVSKGREMYFAIYQAIAKDERRPGLYREYAAGLLRPDHRRRVPPRQRPGREQLAGDPASTSSRPTSSA